MEKFNNKTPKQIYKLIDDEFLEKEAIIKKIIPQTADMSLNNLQQQNLKGLMIINIWNKWRVMLSYHFWKKASSHSARFTKYFFGISENIYNSEKGNSFSLKNIWIANSEFLKAADGKIELNEDFKKMSKLIILLHEARNALAHSDFYEPLKSGMKTLDEINDVSEKLDSYYQSLIKKL